MHACARQGSCKIDASACVSFPPSARKIFGGEGIFFSSFPLEVPGFRSFREIFAAFGPGCALGSNASDWLASASRAATLCRTRTSYHFDVSHAGTKEGACMVVSSPANRLRRLRGPGHVVSGLRHHGSLSESTHAAIDALVVARTGRFHRRPLWAWDRGRLVRPPRFGIRLVRGRDDDGSLDWFDDGERNDREEPSRCVRV